MKLRAWACVCGLSLLALLSGCASDQPINVSISPQTTFVGSGQSLQFTITVTGTRVGVAWSVNGVVGGSATTGTIDANGNYTAPVVTQNATVTVTATSVRDSNKFADASVAIVAPGQVTSTNNPQVALYTITPPATANVSIQFGTDNTYGLTTWSQVSPSGGGGGEHLCCWDAR